MLRYIGPHINVHYITSSVSGQYETKSFAVTVIGCQSLQDEAILLARDFSLGPTRPHFLVFLSHIKNPLLTTFVRSRWLDIGLVCFFFFLACFWVFMERDFVAVHKHANKTK